MDPSVLNIDAAAAAYHITSTLRKHILFTLRRRGAVVAVSGGIDSSVTAALCVRALSKERVLLLSLPDRDSSPASSQLAELLAGRLGLQHVIEDIAPILEASGCYRRQEEAIRTIFPEYGPGWKSKIVIPSILQ
jgi:NAD+ synthase